MMKKQTPETAIKKQIKDWLSLNNWFHFQYPAGVMGYKGAPDRIAIKKGIVLFIEVKAEKGKQSEDQIKFENNITEHGGYYVLVRNYKDLEKYINTFLFRIWRKYDE